MQFLWFILIFSCAPKVPGAHTPAPERDISMVASQVATTLPSWEGFASYKTPPRIVVQPTENLTKFDVDTQLATTKLVNGLIQVSGDQFDVIDPETWAKRESKKVEPGLLFLQSDVRSTPTDAGDGRMAVQILVTYRLVEAESALALWASDFQWIKVKGKEGYQSPEMGTEPETDAVADADPNEDAQAAPEAKAEAETEPPEAEAPVEPAASPDDDRPEPSTTDPDE